MKQNNKSKCSYAAALLVPLLLLFTLSAASLGPIPALSESNDTKAMHIAPEEEGALTCWVDSVLQQLSLEEKIGQLLVYTIAPDESQANSKLLETVIRKYKIGGLLFSGGNATVQARLTNKAQQLSRVPLMITFDGEWGLAMRLKDTPKFPRNSVLGCITNTHLLSDYGREVARQCQEMGVQVNFAPVADVNINPKNPVINTRSFGEIPDSVAHKVAAYSMGLESGGVLSVAKHFPGHGDTQTDSHHALPVLHFSRARLDSVELVPFRHYIRAKLNGIMVGHLSVPSIDASGKPASLSSLIVDGLLKQEMGFDGLVFTDALAMKGVAGSSAVCLEALKAGNDMLLAPRNLQSELPAILKAVKKGVLSEEEITARCRKVLTYKYILGLSHKPHIATQGLMSRIHTDDADRLIERLIQASATVLEDNTHTLPWTSAQGQQIAIVEIGSNLKALSDSLAPHYEKVSRFPVKAGAGDNYIRQLCDSLANYDQVALAISESKLAAYHPLLSQIGHDKRLEKATYLFFIPSKSVKACPGLPRKNGAVILAHTTDGNQPAHAAHILIGEQEATGRSSFSIGNIYPAGSGVDVKKKEVKKEYLFTPFIDYATFYKLKERVDSIACYGIEEEAYPGCQINIWYKGYPLYQKCYGTLSRGGSRAVQSDDIYDLASMTKTSSTLLAVMKLYDQKKIKLTDRLSTHLPWLKGTDKQYITIRDVLYHQSGLPAGISLYDLLIDKESYEGRLFASRPDHLHNIRLGSRLWGNGRFAYKAEMASTRPTDQCTVQICDKVWIHPDNVTKALKKKIVDTPLRSRSYRYSDIGFVLLRFLVEEVSGCPLHRFVAEQFYLPMGLTHTGYLPLEWCDRNHIVPSSHDIFLRQCEIQGFVHDETAAFQGGVSGNAGLFSNAEEQACIYQMLLNKGLWKGSRYLSEETCRLFTTSVSRQSRRGLGFDRPAPAPQKSPCAPATPLCVYGHTGFTGTCAWVDPDHEIVFVFLSNRIYPDMNNRKLMKLDIRGKLQQALYECGL